MANFYLIVTSLAVISILVIGFLVLLHDKKKSHNLVFFLMCVFVVLWLVSVLISDYSKSVCTALLFIKLANFSAVWAIYLFLLFTFIFPKNFPPCFDRLKIYYLIFPSLFSILYFSDLIISGAEIKEWGSNPILGPLASLGALYIIITTIIGLINLIIKYKKMLV